MPTAEQFLEGFGLKKGIMIDGWKLDRVSATEHQVVRWNEYRYPIELVLKHSENINSDYDSFFEDTLANKLISRIINGLEVEVLKIIRTDSGRPYLCNIKYKDIIYEGSKVTVNLEGYGKRVSEKVAKDYE